MNRRIPLIIFGLVGTAILISLGVWQFQRMTWKNNILAEIDARLAQAPVALPITLDPVADKYLQVKVTGEIAEGELHVLTFGDSGPGFRVIAPMVLEDGRRILVDRGFVPETEKTAAAPSGDAARGAKLARGKCGGCHYFDRAKKKVGPGLKGIYGRAPSIDGIPFARWDAQALDQWLARPKAVKPKTRMSFRGLASKQDRDDVIAYLKTL
ncbi:MAG: SURF1 family cytochrome oxidase biogenesis protein [Mariprofundaceae bacterium]|nr:SURF1 family cytochrome oxidase biogenesis protein [Mariprofundaceae bacterium]